MAAFEWNKDCLECGREISRFRRCDICGDRDICELCCGCVCDGCQRPPVYCNCP